jgi:hypothetical protein
MAEIQIVPIFSGTNGEIGVREFICKVDVASKIYSWDDHKKHAIALLRLEGEAWDYIYYCNIPLGDWNSFSQTLIKRFTTNESCFVLEYKFNNCYQLVGESYSKFLSRLTKIASELRHANGHLDHSFSSIYEQRIKYQFITGFTDFMDIKRFVMLRAPSTSLEALKFVEEQSDLLFLKQQQLAQIPIPTSNQTFSVPKYVHVASTNVVDRNHTIGTQTDVEPAYQGPLTPNVKAEVPPKCSDISYEVLLPCLIEQSNDAASIGASQHESSRESVPKKTEETCDAIMESVPKKTEETCDAIKEAAPSDRVRNPCSASNNIYLTEPGSRTMSSSDIKYTFNLKATIKFFAIFIAILCNSFMQNSNYHALSSVTHLVKYVAEAVSGELFVFLALIATLVLIDKVQASKAQKITWKNKNEYYDLLCS